METNPESKKPAPIPTYPAIIAGRKTRVTVPEDPKPQEILADAIRECLSPHAVAEIVAYLNASTPPAAEEDHAAPDEQPPEQRVDRELRWFATLLTDLVGGPDAVTRLVEEIAE